MKKIDFGQGVQVLANLSVLAGIAFLAYEARQINIASQLNAAESYQSAITQMNFLVASNPDLADLIRKRAQGEAVDSLGGFRTYLMYSALFDVYENAYFRSLDGLLDDRYLERLRESVGDRIGEDAGMRRAWEGIKNERNPEFVTFVDRVLADRESE